MYKEVDLFGGHVDIKIPLFRALKNNINGIVCSPTDIALIKEVLPPKIRLIAPIDYPFGLSGSLSKQNSILECAKNGVSDIDFIINHSMLLQQDITKIKKEIETIKEICSKKDVNIRVLIESSLIDEAVLTTVVRAVYNVGITEFLFSSNSSKISYDEILLVDNNLKKKFKNLKTINTGGVWLESQYKTVEKSGIYGLRLYSADNLSYVGV